jgi:glutathione S-transferase
MKINPMATVPAATDDDLTITESNAILMYAAEKGKFESAYPTDVKVRADANRWLLWECSTWFPTNYAYVVENVVKPLLGAQPDTSITDKEAPNWNKAAAILDERLGQTGKWILPGHEPSIVDIAIAAPMHMHGPSKVPLDQHKHLQRWIGEIEQLPAWKGTQAAVDKALFPNKSAEVRAEFMYTKDMGDKLTEIYFYEDPQAIDIHEPGDDAHTMTVRSGWGQPWDMDVNGFRLQSWTPSFDGPWDSDATVQHHLYPEVVALLQQELGARRVLVFDHTIRTRKNASRPLTQESQPSQRAPVRLVHCDYTAESAPVRVRQLLPDDADALLARRVAFVNVWKPLARVEESPLAMCDARSAESADFFKLFLRYRDRVGENYVMRHRPGHRWVYFPHMEKSDTIFLKTYDSDEGRARFVGHSAFDDPNSRPGAPFRESCEIRTICFF